MSRCDSQLSFDSLYPSRWNTSPPLVIKMFHNLLPQIVTTLTHSLLSLPGWFLFLSRIMPRRSDFFDLMCLSSFCTRGRPYLPLKCNSNDSSFPTSHQNLAESLWPHRTLFQSLSEHIYHIVLKFIFYLSVSITRPWAHRGLVPGSTHISWSKRLWLWMHPAFCLCESY